MTFAFASPLLCSRPGSDKFKRFIDSLQASVPSDQPEGFVDGRRHGTSAQCHPQGLGDLTHSDFEFGSRIPNRLIQRLRLPCIKSGEAVDDGGISCVAGNRAMVTCCKNCKGAVEADPAKYIAKVRRFTYY